MLREEQKPILNVENLTVRLPEGSERPFAVEDVSFRVFSGEMVCIAGESGSGKSVTAQSIMGLIRYTELVPVAGKIYLGDDEVLSMTHKQLSALQGVKMSMVFQEPMTALNPVIKIGKQIDEVLRIHTQLNTQERLKKVINIMREVNLPEPERMIHDYPHQLSGGQRQRVMIAMALVLEPDLLIADEPTTALDVTTQASILDLIKDIQVNRGTGVLFITHDFGVISQIADRVLVMKNGKIVEKGPKEDVLNHPVETYTKKLISSVPSIIPPKRNSKLNRTLELEVKNLEKNYGSGGWFSQGRNVHALKGVTFDIHEGETLGLVGESGSGKSTLARCIVRLIEPTAGEIFVQGRDISNSKQRSIKELRKDIQFVFQDPYRSLNPRRTVGQSIIEGPTNYGESKKEALAYAAELMEIVGLNAKMLDRYPHQFSGGQRQRICIARALALKPKVLIADEPVSALDVSVQAQVLKLLDDLRKKYKLAIFFITHDLRVAAQVCDRLLVIQNGIIVEQGATAQIFKDPQHPYTQELLNAVPGRLTL